MAHLFWNLSPNDQAPPLISDPYYDYYYGPPFVPLLRETPEVQRVRRGNVIADNVHQGLDTRMYPQTLVPLNTVNGSLWVHGLASYDGGLGMQRFPPRDRSD